jgi:hypothetical protein
MKWIYLLVFASIPASPVLAENLAQPQYSPDDVWIYRDQFEKGATHRETHDEISVIRVNDRSILLGVKAAGSQNLAKEVMFGLDWSRFRNLNGVETTVNRPLAFPLAAGKSWNVDYVENNPNQQVLRVHRVLPYRVSGWEEIVVPAGKFRALKIEANGNWDADTAPRVIDNAVVMRNGVAAAQSTERKVLPSSKVGGRIYNAYWYAPQVKRWVKAIEESYAPDGTRSESSLSELESYRGVGANPPPPSPAEAPGSQPGKGNDTL